jgi:hypothetical protein
LFVIELLQSKCKVVGPTTPGGERARMDVESTKVPSAVVAKNITLQLGAKDVPETVTSVLPAMGPEDGRVLVIETTEAHKNER